MSAINQALSELARKKGGKLAEIEPVTVAHVKHRSVVPWVIGTFAISLGVGGWAISYQQPSVTSEAMFVDVQASQPVKSEPQPSAESPTAKTTVQGGTIYRSEITAPRQTSDESVSVVQPVMVSEPVINVAQVKQAVAAQATNSSGSGEMVIEQVELTAQQLSSNAQKRAQKALDSNNLDEALAHYSEALKYTPDDVKARKTLSALYYGKGDVRRAADILQKGISQDRDSVELRLSLAKLLMKEQQNAAALTALAFLPDNASVEYLSLRGVLAQKNNQDEIALTSYKKLVMLEPESGRWWLGLAIQQERALEFESAQQSYTKALKGLGLSGQSQQFVRDRLAMIEQLESKSSAN